MMSKLGDMEAVKATEIITSVMNGFNLEAEDMMAVLDKLTQADNMAASSIAEVGTALQRTAVSARQAGVSFEEVAAMITTISETSRKAPETIGESFSHKAIEALVHNK
jgi:TP901 family phage tail tape measure protein